MNATMKMLFRWASLVFAVAAPWKPTTFILASFIAARIAHSQTNEIETDKLAALSFKELMEVQIPTVYGASKHEQSLTEAPSDVTIVTADEIKKAGYRTLAEIINSVRGLYTTSDGAYNYIGTRGIYLPGNYGGEILVTVDGHRMNDAIFGQADSGTSFMVDVDLIDRVEVIRGPGSSLYGNNAFFAVINVITRRGRDFTGGEFSGAWGSYDAYTGRFSYGNRCTNGLEFALSGTYLDSGGNDGVYYPEFAAINRGYAERNGASRAPSVFASLSYEDLSFEAGYIQRKEIVPNGAYGTVFNDPLDVLLDERAFADLKWQRQFDNGWELTTRVYYDHYRYDANYPLPEYAYGNPLYPGTITLNSDRDDSESLGGEMQISKTFLLKHRITAGDEYRHDLSLEQRNYDQGGPTYLNSKPTADTVGAYVQDEYSIFHNLILNAGARYDWFSSFGDTVNPRVALIYSPCTNSTLKAIYGQAFRAPNSFELYYVAPSYVSSEHLRPETIHSYELDYDQVINPHLKMAASVFYYDVDDLISFGLDHNGDSTFGNLASATSKGGEIELDGNWAKGWRAQLTYTYADARDGATGRRLSDSPEHVAKLNLTAPLWHEKVFANLEVLGLGDRNTIGGNELGGYWVANCTLFSREIVKGLDISAGIYNLFDKKYADPVGSDFALDSVPHAGRQFRVKLTYRF